MRLKKLLKEAFDYKAAMRLEEELQTNYRNDIPRDSLIFRGVGNNTGDWSVETIRKDREPRNTYPYFDLLINALEGYMGSDVPRRRHSKFASSSYKVASQFGNYVALCFPERGSNIKSWPADVYDYFDEAQDYLNQIAGDFYDIADDPEQQTGMEPLDTFLEYLVLLVFEKNYEAAQVCAEIIYKESSTLIDQAEDYDEQTAYYTQIGRLQDAVVQIEDFMDDMMDGITPKSEEVVFDGDTYLMVAEEFFHEFFEWNGSNWELKEG